MIKNLARALRLPFLAASILPFVFGSLITRINFNLTGFILGLFAVVLTHLSANLINDYADSQSGVDFRDKNFYPFFGGSKLIQENVFSEKFYFNAALTCAALALLSVILLSLVLKNPPVVLIYLLVIFLSWEYSAKPLQISYHYLGEVFIFILFGPALVMGGYFIQTGAFPGLKSFILSLPSGFFTAAVLFANEVPDFANDQQSNKNNWVRFLGLKRAYLIYACLILFGLSSVILAVCLGFIGALSLVSILLIIPALRAAQTLKENSANKIKMLRSSSITINIQVALSVILILGLFI
jgi:1,4-dihydroxy-2-naphthoate octaprenyltransferase